ncbi:hypothetical protein SKAU_G00166330 [Synaphobranchus kaupii]|uniref:Uncharacterized protein n=1 Tax=Synaphobranchus kaupii TaxID=118154 RepID=A0A9Q1IZX7_SYNKA|nr:hypothetical protein SKAU_G00166330 [Synaphobranchus kaupii]
MMQGLASITGRGPVSESFDFAEPPPLSCMMTIACTAASKRPLEMLLSAHSADKREGCLILYLRGGCRSWERELVGGVPAVLTQACRNGTGRSGQAARDNEALSPGHSAALSPSCAHGRVTPTLMHARAQLTNTSTARSSLRLTVPLFSCSAAPASTAAAGSSFDAGPGPTSKMAIAAECKLLASTCHRLQNDQCDCLLEMAAHY